MKKLNKVKMNLKKEIHLKDSSKLFLAKIKYHLQLYAKIQSMNFLAIFLSITNLRLTLEDIE